MAETLDNLDDALFGDFEDYLAGTLPEARRREVDARLKASPEARALLAEFTEAQTLFRNPVWDVPEPVALPSAQAILDRAKSRPTARKSFLAGMKDWFGVAMWRPALASGFAIALLASGTWLVFRSNQSQTAESVAKQDKQKDRAFYGDQVTPAAPATNAQPGLTADSQTPKSPASSTIPNSPPTRLDDLSKTGTPGTMGDSPAEKPKPEEPTTTANEKTAPADSDGVVATGRANADKGTTDNKPAAAPATKPATTTGSITGGVQPPSPPPSPPPPPKSLPEPVGKTQPVEEQRNAGGEAKDDTSLANRDERDRSAEPSKKKPARRGEPGAAGGGPNNRQQRANENLSATRSRQPQAQSVGLNVSDRDKAVGQLKGIAAQFGGTISVNGSSIEIVVPGDKVDACVARVRQLNQSELKKERDQAPKDTDTKQAPAPAVRLSVTVKEKPE